MCRRRTDAVIHARSEAAETEAIESRNDRHAQLRPLTTGRSPTLLRGVAPNPDCPCRWPENADQSIAPPPGMRWRCAGEDSSARPKDRFRNALPAWRHVAQWRRCDLSQAIPSLSTNFILAAACCLSSWPRCPVRPGTSALGDHIALPAATGRRDRHPDSQPCSSDAASIPSGHDRS